MEGNQPTSVSGGDDDKKDDAAAADTPPLPKKTREMHSHHFDSTMWDEPDFKFRDDDIVIATVSQQLGRKIVDVALFLLSDLAVFVVACDMCT